jgi:mercuric ion transport protein
MSSKATPKFNRSEVAPALRWGALAALTACAACCALPLLIAAGVGGGLLTALIDFGPPRVEAIAAAGIGFGVVAAWVIRARARAARAVDGGCPCSANRPAPLFTTPKVKHDEPVMCSADLSDRRSVQAQLAGYQLAFAVWRRTEPIEHGFRWVFERVPGLEDQLRDLMKNESECCRFFELELESAGDELIWTTRGNSASASVVEEFANLPLRLREHGADEAGIRAIKSHAQTAGLAFAADQPARR